MAQKECILIVEDNGLVADALKLWLQEFGYSTCHIATTAQEAIEAAAAYRPVLTFMDLKLGGNGDGVDAAKQIHTIHGCAIIFLTGDTRPEATHRMLEDRPAAILKKPFSEAELKRALAQVSIKLPSGS